MIFTPSHLFRNLVCTASTVLPRLKTDSKQTTAQSEGIQLHKQAVNSDGVMSLEVLEYMRALEDIPGDLKQELKVSYAGVNGYVDAVIVSDTDLHIIDFKTGYTEVSPEFNPQLLFYALALRMLYTNRVIYLHIYQRKLKTWNPTNEEIENFNVLLLKTIEEVEAGKIEAVIDNHCINCPCAMFCAKLEERTRDVDNYLSSNYELILENKELNDELIRLRDASNILKARQMALQELAQHKLKSGELFDNWVMRNGKSYRKWIDEEEIKKRGWVETTVQSPAQVEKTRGVKTDELTVKIPGERKLTYINSGFGE